MPKKRKRLITDTASWMEAFSIFYLILCLSFPHRWRDLTSYKLLILGTYHHFSGFCWLDYDQAFWEHAAAEKVNDWSKMLFNYHRAGAQVCTRPASSSVVFSQAEASGNASCKVICHSWNAGHCIAVHPQCRFRHACSRCWGRHRALWILRSQSVARVINCLALVVPPSSIELNSLLSLFFSCVSLLDAICASILFLNRSFLVFLVYLLLLLFSS